MSSPAHEIIEQQRQLVADLLEEAEQQPASEGSAELSARLIEAQTELKGMERIFSAVFGRA
jgi:hypothetical protein